MSRRLALWLSLVLALAAPPAATAHADFQASEPAPGSAVAEPPATVRVALATEVEGEFLLLEVVGPSGRVVSGPARRDPDDAAAVLAPLRADGPGSYGVTWRVMSRDGHPDSGSFVFGVGGLPQASAPAAPGHGDADPLAVLARFLLITGPIALLGLAALRLWIVGPAWSQGGVRPPGADASAVRAAAAGPLELSAPRWWRVWWGACVATAVGLALIPGVTLSALGAGAGDLGGLLSGTRFGVAWTVQVLALLVAVAVALVWWRGSSADAPAPPPWTAALVAAPAVALAAVSWLGHASQGADPELGIAIDAVHSWASAVWLGGLVALSALLPTALSRMDDPARTRLAAGVVVRFSAAAVAAVAIVLVTGVYRALVELDTLADLLDTAYGRALGVKLALVALLLVGGAVNRFVVHPRLERAALGLADDDRGAGRALRASVGAELVLSAGVMVAVAALVSLAPPG